MDTKYFTVKEVAEMLKVDAETIRRYIKSGKIKAIKLENRLLRIPFKEITYLFPEDKTDA